MFLPQIAFSINGGTTAGSSGGYCLPIAVVGTIPGGKDPGSGSGKVTFKYAEVLFGFAAGIIAFAAAFLGEMITDHCNKNKEDKRKKKHRKKQRKAELAAVKAE